MKPCLLPLILLMLFTGCKTQESKKAIWFDQMRTLVNVVENRESISDLEWIDFEKEYTQLNTVNYRELERTFTTSEFEEIKLLRNRYSNRKLKSNIANTIKDGIEDVKEVIEEALK